MQGTSAIGSEGRQDWGDARAAFIAIRDEVVARRLRGHSLRRIYRDLKPPISYGALTYHVRKSGEETAARLGEGISDAVDGEDETTIDVQSIVDGESPSAASTVDDKIARLRQLGEKAGHHGRRTVYDPSANSHEDLFGPPKE